MSTVDIQPMPEWARNTRFRPHHPPIFTDGDPTPDDRILALELWRLLDPQSKRWYVRQGATTFVGLPLTMADLDSMGGSDT